jgi:outer membrane protein
MKSRKILFFIFFPSLLYAQENVLTAGDAINIALQNNLQIQIVKYDAEAAKINNNWGNAGKWPTLTAFVGNTESLSNLNQELSNGSTIKRNGVTNNVLNSNLNFSWRIYNGMRVRATKSRLEELEKIGEINVQQQIAQVVFDVKIAYYNLVRLNQQVKALEAIIDLSQERYKIAETRFNVGSAAKTDMLQSKIDLNEQQISMSEIQRQIVQTKATLNNLMKRPANPDFNVSDTSFTVEAVNFEEYSKKIQTSNYDLLRAQRDFAVLVQQRREINSQRLPVLTLNSVTSYNRNKASGGFFLVNQTFGPNIGLGLSIPLFNSNIFKTQLKINEVQQKNQKLITEDLQNQLQLQLVNAYQEYLTALGIVKVEKANVELATENNFISTERFRKLQSNSIELRQAQLSLIEAQNRLINAQYRAKIAETSIMLIAGDMR